MLIINNTLQRSRLLSNHSAGYFETEALYSHTSSRNIPKQTDKLAGYCEADNGCLLQQAWASTSVCACSFLEKATYKYPDHDPTFNVCQLQPL